MTIDLSVTMATKYRGVEYWYAIDRNTYDGAPDSNSLQGSGHSKWEAIRDLIDQMEESDEDEKVA